MADAPTPRQNVSFPSGEGTAHGYLARPDAGSGPGLVVIQEWWGLTDHIAEVTDRFAAEGFVALAPDLYGGTTTHDAGEAMQLMRELPVERATRDLAGAVDHLLADETVTSSTVGAVGFCMGGGFVLTLAAQQGQRVAAAVPFYGTVGDDLDFSGLRARVQGHFAERDRIIPLSAVDRLEQRLRDEAGVEPSLHVYPADHAFLNDANPATYDAQSARLAWQRTVAFLREHVR
jgi:carboxymethylenebutenolidase